MSVALMANLMLSYSRQFSAAFSATPWTPSFSGLRVLFYDLFPDGLFLLVLVMIWIVLTPTRTGNIQEEPMPPVNRWAGCFSAYRWLGSSWRSGKPMLSLAAISSAHCPASRLHFVLVMAPPPRCSSRINWNFPDSGNLGSSEPDEDGLAPGLGRSQRTVSQNQALSQLGSCPAW